LQIIQTHSTFKDWGLTNLSGGNELFEIEFTLVYHIGPFPVDWIISDGVDVNGIISVDVDVKGIISVDVDVKGIISVDAKGIISVDAKGIISVDVKGIISVDVKGIISVDVDEKGIISVEFDVDGKSDGHWTDSKLLDGICVIDADVDCWLDSSINWIISLDVDVDWISRTCIDLFLFLDFDAFCFFFDINRHRFLFTTWEEETDDIYSYFFSAK